MIKSPPAMQETQVQSLGQEDALEKEMATHSSILAWCCIESDRTKISSDPLFSSYIPSFY